MNSKDLETFKQFQRLRNTLVKVIRKAKKTYLHDLFSRDMHRPDLTWKKLDPVLSLNCRNNQIETIFHEGFEVSGYSLVNLFNDLFISQFSNPHSEENHLHTASMMPLTNTILLSPTEQEEVRSTIANLKNSNASDANNLRMKPVKYVVDLIPRPLTHIFDIILSKGVFPQQMQIAKVAIIFKSGDRDILKNYRPISILPVFSKAIEKANPFPTLQFF